MSFKFNPFTGTLDLTNASFSPSTGNTITQTAHGLAVQDIVRFNGTNYVKAKADSAANAEVVGIVSAAASANAFTLFTSGYISTLSGLSAGTVYFLSDATAGLLTATEPTADGSVSKPLFIASSTTAGYFFNLRGEVLPSLSGGGGDMLKATYDPANIAEQLVGLVATQTLTNKTLTSPKINENVALTTTATKLNYLTSATGTTGTASTNVVFSTSPILTTPNIGTPSAGVLTNCTGLPVAGGGTGAATLGDAGVLIGNGTGAIQVTSAGTSGQVLTSNGAGVDPTFQAAAAGGGLTWSAVTVNATMAVNTGSLANKGTLLTLTLPTTASVGAILRVAGMNAGLWLIAQNASGKIYFGNQSTTTGTGGSLASTLTYDAVELVCVVANNEWTVVSSLGNLTVT